MSDKLGAKKKKPFLLDLFIHLLGSFYLFTFIMCFGYLFTHPKIVTLTFTNIGFAVFLTLANTFFSWGRSLDEKKHKNEIKDINHISYWAIIGALTFLLTSVLLLIINSKTVTSEKVLGADIFYTMIEYVRGFLLFFVTAIAFAILFEAYRSIFKLFKTEYFSTTTEEQKIEQDQ